MLKMEIGFTHMQIVKADWDRGISGMIAVYIRRERIGNRRAISHPKQEEMTVFEVIQQKNTVSHALGKENPEILVECQLHNMCNT